MCTRWYYTHVFFPDIIILEKNVIIWKKQKPNYMLLDVLETNFQDRLTINPLPFSMM